MPAEFDSAEKFAEYAHPERLVTIALELSRHRAGQANCGLGSHAEAFRFEPVYPFVDIRELLPPAPAVRSVFDRRKK